MQKKMGSTVLHTSVFAGLDSWVHVGLCKISVTLYLVDQKLLDNQEPVWEKRAGIKKQGIYLTPTIDHSEIP